VPMSSSCLFCKIIAGSIPSHKLLETEQTFVFLDINPLSKGHCLIIPKHHAEKLHELPPEAVTELGSVLVRVARALNVADYNVLQNNGAIAHQVVKHVHFHIIPKTETSGLGIVWPSQQVSKEELAAVAEEIRQKL